MKSRLPPSLRFLIILLLVAIFAFDTAIAALPDPVRFGARMEMGNVEQARQWLDEGLDPNFIGDRIGTGMMIGAWIGNIPLMELFLSRGADIHKTNSFGETALLQAAWRGNAEAVKWLLAHGAKLDREGQEWSALHYAAFAGHADVAGMLIERGADINARSPNGSSVLMMAIYEGHEDLARQLIERGADRSTRNEHGQSALDWAIKYNRGETARLIGSAADVAAASRPPAATALRSQPEPESVEELLRIRRALQARSLSLKTVDRRVAAMRAQAKRRELAAAAAAARAARLAPRLVLEISASRNNPAEQKMELIRR